MAAREHFGGRARAEYYWSLVQMCHNVNESLREQEASGPDKGANENTSYASKIKNGLALDDVYAKIDNLRKELFKGNEEAEADFIEVKTAGTFLDQRRRNNGK